MNQSQQSQYEKYNVLWGKSLPIISLYDHNWTLIDEWRFELTDNFRIEFITERVIDSEEECEDGTIRQRIRGFRLYMSLSVENIENRALLNFLRKMYSADHIAVKPHDGTMQNPNTGFYTFEMLLDSDFEPKYFDGRWIGHTIDLVLKTKDLLIDIPRDTKAFQIIPARTEKIAGVEQADRQVSLTFFNEKMIYGGWELSEDELKEIAYIEKSPEGEEDPYGVWP